MDQDATLCGGPGEIVLDGDPAPASPKRGWSPQFSVHVYCGKMAGWMKTPLGTEVDLCLGHIVLDGVPAAHERGTAARPLFSGLCLLWPRSPISATADLLFHFANWVLYGCLSKCYSIFQTVFSLSGFLD